ncbi:hypothetical protein WDW86_13995 [Bdellovibrionota bacterium FG-2]
MDVSEADTLGGDSTMGVSNTGNVIPIEGAGLVEQVIALTGLSERDKPVVRHELDEILEVLELAGRDEQSLTLDDLRKTMLEYLEKTQESLYPDQEQL